MRHDTPSTARWWIVSSRRPATSVPASNHTACTITPAAGDSRAAAACACAPMTARRASSQKPAMSTRHTQAPASTAPERRDLETPAGALRCRHQPQPQRIVVIKQRLQCTNKVILAQTRRHLQQHRLMEAIDPPAALQEPAHDRRRRNYAARHVGQSRRGLLDKARNPRKRRHGLILEHPRGVIKSPALRARLTSWIDMMLSPPSSKKLSSMPTRSRPSTSANSAHRISSCGLRGPRPPQTAIPPAPEARDGPACRWAEPEAAPAPRSQTAPCAQEAASPTWARSKDPPPHNPPPPPHSRSGAASRSLPRAPPPQPATPPRAEAAQPRSRQAQSENRAA